MRGTKAKALRRQVYSDMSHQTREYLKGHEPQRGRYGGVSSLTGKPYHYGNPTCICTGLRRKYQDAK